MAGFIYAIPNVKTATAEILEETGLAAVFGEATEAQRQIVTGGPGGGGCVIFCIGADSKQLYYRPDEQSWAKSLNGKYHIGFLNAEPPTPAELERPEQIAGHTVKLGEHEWRIPLARMFPEGTLLPSSLLMGSEGRLITEIIPKYAEFSSRAEKIWRYVSSLIGMSKKTIEISDEELWLAAVEALSLNYRIGADEVNALKLLTTANMTEIFKAVVDFPTILEVGEQFAEAQKKTEEAEGEEGATIDDG